MLLSETVGSKEKIRLAEIRVEDQGTLLASIRYKPEDDSRHETDRYGYAQTEPPPAMDLRNLSEKEVAQVEEFVEDTMAQKTIYATKKKSIREIIEKRASNYL